MHDPDTVIFSKFGVTIYHHDPCTDNTDDSCGWSTAKLTKEEKEIHQSNFKYEKSCYLDIYKLWKQENRNEIVYSLYQTAKWNLYKKGMTQKDILYVTKLCFNIHDNIKIYEEQPEYEFERLYHQMGKLVKSRYRKWWQHPKFHFHHWSISINWFKKRLSIGQKLDDTPIMQRIDW